MLKDSSIEEKNTVPWFEVVNPPLPSDIMGVTGSFSGTFFLFSMSTSFSIEQPLSLERSLLVLSLKKRIMNDGKAIFSGF